MTREEILDYFKDINFMYNNPSMFDTLKHMLDELTEPCEDAVSREAVRKAFRDWIADEHNWGYEIRNDDVDNILSDLPSVTPERQKGEWIDQKCFDEWYCPTGKCSICGKEHIFGLNFCPNCGADMRGEKK